MASLIAVQHLQARAHSCGYCRSGRDSDGDEEDEGDDGPSKSFGMWVSSLSAEQYERLMERGWRRSGMYIYRPFNQSTCCPQHPIRLTASEFQPSKVWQGRSLNTFQGLTATSRASCTHILLVQEQRRLWRKVQQILLGEVGPTDAATALEQRSSFTDPGGQQSDPLPASDPAAIHLTEHLAAAVTQLTGSADLPPAAARVKLAPVQAATAKQRKHLPDTVQYTSAAALPIAAAISSDRALSASHVAKVLAESLGDRYPLCLPVPTPLRSTEILPSQ